MQSSVQLLLLSLFMTRSDDGRWKRTRKPEKRRSELELVERRVANCDQHRMPALDLSRLPSSRVR